VPKIKKYRSPYLSSSFLSPPFNLASNVKSEAPTPLSSPHLLLHGRGESVYLQQTITPSLAVLLFIPTMSLDTAKKEILLMIIGNAFFFC
jgi:hypothetical protein